MRFVKQLNKVVEKLLYSYMFLGVLLVNNEAFAQTGEQTIRNIFANATVKNVLTFGFILLAVAQWIDYISNFKIESALRSAITPAIITFMAFQWEAVFRLVGIIS